jgi:hypothetical protein
VIHSHPDSIETARTVIEIYAWQDAAPGMALGQPYGGGRWDRFKGRRSRSSSPCSMSEVSVTPLGLLPGSIQQAFIEVAMRALIDSQRRRVLVPVAI